MNKKRLIAASLLLLVIALLATVSTAYAELPGGGWWTAQQIQAIGGDDTTVSHTAYGVTSGEYSCGDITLNDGEAFVYLPTDAWGITPNCGNLPDSFQGSAVASANKEIVAVVEETNQDVAPLGVSGGTADASYRGTNNAATTLRFPAYKSDHAGETSTFYIQNAGSESTRLRATFQECSADTQGCEGTGATYVYTLTTPLESNRMAIIVPSDAAGMPSGDGYFGGLTVESLDDQPLAGVVNEHATTADPARYLKSTRAFVEAEYDTKLYAPTIKHTYPLDSDELTKWSALQIQNASATETGNFTITYKIAASQADPNREGNVYTDTTTCQNIAPGQTCFAMTLFAEPGSGTDSLQAGEYGAATVVGDVPMVAVVNEETLYDYTPGGDKQFATYSAVPDKEAKTSVSVPAYKEEWQGRYMGVTVMNVGTGAATVDATVKNVGVEQGATEPTADLVAQKTGLAEGAATTFFLLTQDQAQTYEGITIVSGNVAEFANTNNSMSISSGGQRLAVIVNQENSYLNPPSTLLDAANYEGFPLD
jgi:hypothetical protein